jgi:cystathionine beta-lyase/cystathionine gamma-synthase
MADRENAFDTRLIHAGEPKPRLGGAVAMPIFQSANFVYAGEEDYHALKYIRLNNTPNHEALHQKLAALEGGEALVFGSGMAAISTTLLSLLQAGDHLLIQDVLYGGTHDLVVHDLPALGISSSFIDPDAPATWRALLTPKTRAIYVEAMSNPLLGVPDLEAIVAFAKENGLVTVIDNTFASPVNYRPLEHGFDLSVHSATKYLNGHSDIVAGAAIGRSDLVKRIKKKLDHFGGSLDPHAAYLLHRGMKTLSVRVRQQNASALEIARALEKSPGVQRVNYAGLESHPRHDRARRLFDGFGGVLSFELAGGKDAVERLFKSVQLPVIAPSLGGTESLLTQPSRTSHAGLSPEARQRIGISDGLVRMSVGLEDPKDLIDDLLSSLR